jgi:murein DD-endopeptidase MepM/ murein hydrolase activator NlpD
MLKKYSAMLLILLGICMPVFSYAETAAELQAKIDAQNQSITAIEREIALYQQELAGLGKQKDTLANAIQILTLESKKLSADIRVTEGKISATNLKLDSLGISIQKTGASIDDLKNAIAKGLRTMNANDKTTLTKILLSKEKLSEIWHVASQESALRASMKEKVDALEGTKKELTASKVQVESVKHDLVILRAQLTDQQTINNKTQAQKTALLKATKNQEASYAKIIAQKAQQKAQLEADIRDYESKLKYVLNPSSLPPAGSSPFSWPLDKIIITQLFGKTSASARLYATGSHNGVDFGASTGTPVKALASGVVVGSGNADIACPGASYGIWILIRYDNGLTAVFGHLSLIKASTGTRVNRGDVVAYSGSTGYATGPHLHVSVFPNDGIKITSFPSKSCVGKTLTVPVAATNAYLDPMLYFPKI